MHALAYASHLFKSLLHSLISCCIVGLVLSRSSELMHRDAFRLENQLGTLEISTCNELQHC